MRRTGTETPPSGSKPADFTVFHTLISSRKLQPADPLWKRAPTRDEKGGLLTDFLMIIPRMRHRPPHQIHRRLERIRAVLEGYGETVVFAEVNLRLNTLWVTVRPVPGICLTLPTAIKQQIPEALLVGQNHPERQ